MSQEDYNAHYDATAAVGLCWEGDGNPQFVQDVILPTGERMSVESLWCVECAVRRGEIVASDESLLC